MKPGKIRVFDGLRVTTEHINHFQGSLRTAIEDIREIIGLGKICYGFEVLKEGENSITIQPGLAFDLQKNRIVCDEPKTLDVSFKSDEGMNDTQYVCIKYVPVEDGQVEGIFTLIWDSCSIIMRPTLPDPEENLILIAKLIESSGEEGNFEIVSFKTTEQIEDLEEGRGSEVEDEREGGGNEKEVVVEPQGEESTISTKNEEAIETPEISSEIEIPGESEVEDESSNMEAETSTVIGESENTPSPEITMEKSEAGRWGMRVKQGVERITSDVEMGNSFSTLILGPLKEKLSMVESSKDVELLVPLQEKEVCLDFPVTSLTCKTIITGNLTMNEGPNTTEVNETEEEIAKNKNLKYQSTAEGEATFSDDEVSQYGISAIQTNQKYSQEDMLWWSSELTELGIGHLPFSFSLNGAENEGPEDTSDIHKNLQLLIKVKKASHKGFKVNCSFLWKGGVTDEIVKETEKQKFLLTWKVLLAWKAIGVPSCNNKKVN